MANIKLYNTMSRQLEDFKPLVPGVVSFYSCGPTVYWDQHIGNMRAYITYDILKRMFIENGYDVKHVMNITDVGHLTSDMDSGEDKMEKGAKRENITAWDVAKRYTESFLNDTQRLNNMLPILTRATDYIPQQIKLVQDLEKLGYTYEIPGDGIYYDTSKFADYGKLGHQDLSELKSGARIDDSGKRNPTDFAVWKFSPKNEKRSMEWDSPWGVGFPGWHAECSAMSLEKLGNKIDIHSGGQEHIKVHHTNEIAQTEAITGEKWVNYWVHFEWLMDKTGKMSKSSGDFLTLTNLESKGYDPMAYRYLLLTGHYKSPMSFSFDALDAAAAGYKNIVKKVANIKKNVKDDAIQSDKFDLYHEKILSAVSDNLKTAVALAIIQELLSDDAVNNSTKIALFEFIDRLLGLQILLRADELFTPQNAPENIQQLANDRLIAKQNKDWGRADSLRAEIDAAGWTILDTKDGFELTKK